jgi:hypothetical protein
MDEPHRSVHVAHTYGSACGLVLAKIGHPLGKAEIGYLNVAIIRGWGMAQSETETG